MTSAESLIHYPSYCFHLSPTINKWCPLRASDIARLECRSGFEGQDVFFHLNHPLRWVRVAGVVVAIDEYHGRHVYTVDDSTGQCIECVVVLPKPPDADAGDQRGKISVAERVWETAKDGGRNPKDVAPKTEVPADLDIGMVVDVKGSLKLFRDQKQIKVHKIQEIKSTNAEVQFWTKVLDFRRDVLTLPWILDPKEVRRCRKMQEAEVETENKRKHRKKTSMSEKSLDSRRHSVSNRHLGDESNLGPIQSAKTRLSSKTEGAKTYAEGQYDALGL